MVKISCRPLQTVASRPLPQQAAGPSLLWCRGWQQVPIRFFLILFFVFISLPSRAGLREDVEYLSSPLLGGRATGSVGAVETTWYVQRRFRAAGLETSMTFLSTSGGVVRNVIGIHRGNPKSSSYVLVTAYYDGLGTVDGVVYPGADANASGVAVLLSLADSLSRSASNYIFAAIDGHNAGRIGAELLAREPWKVSLVANIDIIGSSLAPPTKVRPDYLIILGGDDFEKKNSKQFDALNAGPRLRLFYDYYRSKGFTDYFYNSASDQTPFLQKKIPAVMFTSGITMNTNKPADTFDTLDYDVLERRRALILAWLKTL